MAYLTTDLIQDVRSQCRIADNDPDYTDVNLLRIATQELMGNIYPFLIGLREDYFVQECLIQVISGQNFYEISDRAFAGTLREIKLINSVSGETVNLKRYDYEEPQANTARSYGVPTGFVVQDNYLIFDLIPSSNNWTLVQYIWLKPSKLVLPSQCATLVSGTNGTWTISSPSGAVTSALGAGTIDIVNCKSPHNTKCFQNVILTNPTTITGVYGSPKAGDFVCPENTNPTISMPEEYSQMLVIAVAARVFESLNLQTELQTVVGKLDKMKADFSTAVVPRIEGAQKTIQSIL